jgi:hypothetical protein
MAVTARHFYSIDPIDIDPAEECEFFSSLKMRNGTFKLTRPSRFAGLNAEIASVIEERSKDLREVLDIGASTGSTTIELADFLGKLGCSPNVVGTDLFIDAHLVKLLPGLRVLADAEGWPLQYDIAGLPVRAWVRRLDYLTFTAGPRLLARALVRPRLRRKIREGQTTPVRMESRALAGRDVKLVENDIFALTPSFVGRFDFIRAANILNIGYFPADRMVLAISNIRSYCRGPGALLLVVRSVGPAMHDGTLFELKDGGRFEIRARIGKGSEIEPLVLDVRETAAGRRS